MTVLQRTDLTTSQKIQCAAAAVDVRVDDAQLRRAVPRAGPRGLDRNRDLISGIF